jgi:hypothetical protein
MRDKRWDEARATLNKVQTKIFLRYKTLDGKSPVRKGSGLGEDKHSGINSSWVMQDLKAIDAMDHLEQVVENARGDDAKAEAMYQYASYQFDADSLLFYNPTLPGKDCGQTFFPGWSKAKKCASPREEQLIFEYSQLPQTLARSIPIYVEIMKNFPRQKRQKTQCVSAAVAHERLSDLNEYWRDIYRRGLYAGPRIGRVFIHRSNVPAFSMAPIEAWLGSRNANCQRRPSLSATATPVPKLTRTPEGRTEYSSVLKVRMTPESCPR